MKSKLNKLSILFLLLFATAKLHADPNVITSEVVATCKGSFWVPHGGTHGGGDAVGDAVVKILRNKASNEPNPWYSAKINAEGDPANPGVVIRDYEFISVRRAYYPDFPEGSAFAWKSGPGEVRKGFFTLSIGDFAYSSVIFTYPETAQYTFKPDVSCVWSPGEGHTIFQP